MYCHKVIFKRLPLLYVAAVAYGECKTQFELVTFITAETTYYKNVWNL